MSRWRTGDGDCRCLEELRCWHCENTFFGCANSNSIAPVRALLNFFSNIVVQLLCLHVTFLAENFVDSTNKACRNSSLAEFGLWRATCCCIVGLNPDCIAVVRIGSLDFDVNFSQWRSQGQNATRAAAQPRCFSWGLCERRRRNTTSRFGELGSVMSSPAGSGRTLLYPCHQWVLEHMTKK